jgi:hypothetical protein
MFDLIYVSSSDSHCDPVANGVDTSLLEHVSPIEWDNVVLDGQYILDRKLVRRRRRSMKVALSVKLHGSAQYPYHRSSLR